MAGPPAEVAISPLDATGEEGSALKDLVIITGFSGAGKSTAMNVFEDAGYFCVDNLPPRLIGSLIELFVHAGSKVERAAVVSDVRGGEYFDALLTVLDDLRGRELSHRVLFLDADEQTLRNRYQETRRRHPLAGEGSVSDGIAAERRQLAPLKERADLVIDTTELSSPALRVKLVDAFLGAERATKLAVTFASFGFKHGPLRDADLLIDVRFLANPHYEPDLRALDGTDPRVVEFIDRDGRLTELYALLEPLLDFLLVQYVGEGKAHLLVAIGCTGGRHRSVAVVEHLAERYARSEDVLVQVAHRDVARATTDG
ncbi:MAG TPA: RNase adapter RapZ [Solirubrobacteraceae bacterium]|nr:RNase adapter RapZ [Solirubrobacteraceae bacterium]